MNPFKEYDEIVKKVNSLNIEELKKEFNILESNEQINILIKWFGSNPLFKEMVNNKDGLKYLRDSLVCIKNEVKK